ncbi:MAG: nuclear transport factor 2 family protein [Proteobacteria bacterium]|nr:nuclear transport factor 2 family protein [Pseudomonadota bacterium]
MGYGRDFMEKRFKYVMAGQADLLVEEQYHDDAVLLAFARKFAGKPAILKAFSEFVRDRVESIDLLELTETEDQIFCRVRMVRESGILLAKEALYLVDGKVFRQFSDEQKPVAGEENDSRQAAATREVVETYFKTVNAGDWDGWLALFDKEIVFTEPMGTVHGLDGMGQAVKGLKAGYKTFQNQLLKIFVDGNSAVACTQIRAVTMGGVPINVKSANLYWVKNNRIVNQENLFDAQQLKPFLDQKLS